MNNAASNLNLVLLNIGYSELNANWNWKDIRSPFARIYYVDKGMARTKLNGYTFELKPNHLYLTPPFTLHDDECDEYFSLYYIHFYESTINTATVFDKFNFPVEVSASHFDLELIQRLLQINPDRNLKYFDPQFYDNPPTFSQYIAENSKLPYHTMVETQGILTLLMSRFLARRTDKLESKDKRINIALQYIHNNVHNNIQLSNLTELLHISNDHLIRIFKSEMNYTPLKYIILKKIEKAQLLLLTTNLSIKDVAYELSFDNISYFTRLFKSYTNKTPSEYRSNFSQ